MGRSTGQANPNDYVLGRGIVYFASVNASGFPLEFRDLGNCPEFSASLESERIEHQSSRQGLKVTDKEVVISTSASITMTLDEINLDNLALFLSGDVSEFAQAGGSVLGVQNVVLSPADAGAPETALGKWYDLYTRADMSSGAAYPGNAADVRAYNLQTSGFAAEKTLSTALTEGVDYEVDYTMGRIFLFDTPANRAEFPLGTETMDVDFTTLSTDIQEAAGLTTSEISGALKFIQKNAANNSVQAEYHFHSVTLSPEGDLALIGDEFGTMQFTGKAEAREAVDPSAPVVRIRTYTDAGVS